MGTTARKKLSLGIFVMACTAAALSSAGCESSGQMAVSPTNPMCPICSSTTQAQPTDEVSHAKAVCPTCGDVAAVDQNFLNRLEIFSGGPVGDTVYACALCGTITEQCIACRQKGYAAAGRTGRDWQWGLPSTARSSR